MITLDGPIKHLVKEIKIKVMSKTTDYIIQERNNKVKNKFEKEGYKNLKTEDLELLYGYYTGSGEVLKNGEKGICLQSSIITIVHCDGGAGGYSRSVFTISELEKLVEIIKK